MTWLTLGNEFTIPELYILTGIPKDMKQSSKDLKVEIGKSILIVRDFNLSLSILERTIRKEIEHLSAVINQPTITSEYLHQAALQQPPGGASAADRAEQKWEQRRAPLRRAGNTQGTHKGGLFT